MRNIFTASNFTAGQAYAAATVALLAPMLLAGTWWQLAALQLAATVLLSAEARWALLSHSRVQAWAWRGSVFVATGLLACVATGTLPGVGLLWAVIGGVGAVAVLTGGARLAWRGARRVQGALLAQGHHRGYCGVLVLNAAVAATFSVTFALGVAADWQAGSLGALPWAARTLLVLALVRAVVLHRLRQAPEYGRKVSSLRFPAGRVVPATVFLTAVSVAQHLPVDPASLKLGFMVLSASFAGAQVIVDHFLPTSLSPVPVSTELSAPKAPATPVRRLSISVGLLLAAAVVLEQVRVSAGHRTSSRSRPRR